MPIVQLLEIAEVIPPASDPVCVGPFARRRTPGRQGTGKTKTSAVLSFSAPITAKSPSRLTGAWKTGSLPHPDSGNFHPEMMGFIQNEERKNTGPREEQGRPPSEAVG